MEHKKLSDLVQESPFNQSTQMIIDDLFEMTEIIRLDDKTFYPSQWIKRQTTADLYDPIRRADNPDTIRACKQNLAEVESSIPDSIDPLARAEILAELRDIYLNPECSPINLLNQIYIAMHSGTTIDIQEALSHLIFILNRHQFFYKIRIAKTAEWLRFLERYRQIMDYSEGLKTNAHSALASAGGRAKAEKETSIEKTEFFRRMEHCQNQSANRAAEKIFQDAIARGQPFSVTFETLQRWARDYRRPSKKPSL